MNQYNIPEISKNVFAVGSKDWNRKIFDSLIPLPKGTSYNSYLIKGNNQVALIDTVNPGFEKELLEKIEKTVGLKNVNYLIMNHAEPDHAGSIPQVIAATPAILVASERGAKIAETYYNVPKDRIKSVKEGDTIDLGGKTLKFIDAPWLHWPETIFTYLVEDKILFPCDFFGHHTAFGIYDSDVDNLLSDSQRYFAEIMMPFKTMGKKAMDKLKNYEIKIIAPSHGPIHKNPKIIIDAYNKWTAGETKNKAIVVYASMWGSTEGMIKQITETLQSEGIEVASYNLATADIGEIAKDLVDARGIVFGSPTVLGHLHPLGVYAAHLVKVLKPSLKYAVFLSSYGWVAGAGKNTLEILGNTGINILGALEVNGKPTEEDNKKIIDMGKQLASKIKDG